ncbi:MAG TPA: retropepsin-like aspartic protease [Xylanibacter oryzae]|nr:retropepsin-like aspartic protease [Xylanibacter oryzae]
MNITFCLAQGFIIPKDKFIDTLNIEIVDGYPTIPVKIKDRTYKFLLDTGSDATYISKVDIPGIILTGDTTNVVGFESGRRANAIIENIQIGNLNFGHIPATVHRVTSTDEDGIIGYNFLKAGIVAKLQMRDRKLILSNDLKAFDSEKGKHIKLLKGYNFPMFYTEPLKGIKTVTMLDTGNPDGYLLSMQSWKKYKETIKGKSPDELIKQIVWFNFQTLPEKLWGEIGEDVFFRFDNIKLKDISFRRVAGSLVKVPFSNMGTRFCEDFDIIINAPKNELICLTDKKEFYPETSGVNFKPVSYYGETQQRICSLNPKIELYKLGVRFGDIIDEVDGITIDCNETLRRALRGKKTVRMKLTTTKGKEVETEVSEY